MQQPATSLPFR